MCFTSASPMPLPRYLLRTDGRARNRSKIRFPILLRNARAVIVTPSPRAPCPSRGPARRTPLGFFAYLRRVHEVDHGDLEARSSPGPSAGRGHLSCRSTCSAFGRTRTLPPRASTTSPSGAIDEVVPSFPALPPSRNRARSRSALSRSLFAQDDLPNTGTRFSLFSTRPLCKSSRTRTATGVFSLVRDVGDEVALQRAQLALAPTPRPGRRSSPMTTSPDRPTSAISRTRCFATARGELLGLEQGDVTRHL